MGIYGGEEEGSFDVVMARSAMPTFVPGEIIVKIKEGAAAALSQGEMGQLGLESTSRRTSGGEMVYKFVPEEMARMETLSAQESQDQTLAIVKELEANPNVEYAQPNWLLQPFSSP
ncbi:peptidase S8 and S53 subtilisin kexin sedolisin [Nitrosococcus halophilus Nc 4]|uniref:Peptidase S8 and S53 subtilisin kexin sedolisin n=1 Tax=Nitrosococcus halophilus (strain Nc4) TaxID=472759 RepID=D5C169_NITHN|nr:peptidase S8 [Nitrosococcus halophilus]ADE14626.1 peptidase S8 and S53 subtilisin kexin sedolisin [Nitrosococcus halophilus Nc 4]